MKMFFISTLFALFSLTGFAGTITITPGSTNPTSVGAVYQNAFSVTSTDPNDLLQPQWKIDPVDQPTADYYKITIGPATGLMTGNPYPAHSGDVPLHIIYTSGSTSGTQEILFTLTILRMPVDLVLVLDKSGSMSSSYDGTNPFAPAGHRRWDGLVTGVGVIASLLSGTVPTYPADKIGLRYFQSNVPPAGSIYNGGVIPITGPNLDSLTANVSRNGPGTNTALGDGIVEGRKIQLPGTAGNRKAMIVFSDGLQNSGDLVQTSGGDAYKKTVAGHNLSKDDMVSDTAVTTINTICLNISGDNPATMEAIADNNGPGEYTNGSAFDNNTFTTTSFLGTMQSILSGSSPQYIDVRSGQFKADSGKQAYLKDTFTVNKSVSSLFVALAALNARITSVVKDGQELIQYIKKSSGPGYQAISVSFPMSYFPALKPEGQWIITATGNVTTPGIAVAAAGAASPDYTISMTVEDHLNHISYSLNRGLKVGDTLHAAASIIRNISPLTTATVQALVIKPGDDINDLIARADVKYTVTPGDSSTPNVYKLAELLKDSAFLTKIKGLNRLVSLTYDPGTKTYTGSYPELDIAGVYRVIYTVSNNDTNGIINRYYLKSFNVRFKDVDLGASGVSVTIDSLTRNAIIIFRPVSSTGKYIGSGWGSSIGLQAQTAGLKIVSVEDLGDGSYKLHLSGPLSGDGVLTIANDTVYSGNLGDITKGNGGSGTGGGLFHHWWFWLLLLLVLLLIIWGLRKKNP